MASPAASAPVGRSDSEAIGGSAEAAVPKSVRRPKVVAAEIPQRQQKVGIGHNSPVTSEAERRRPPLKRG